MHATKTSVLIQPGDCFEHWHQVTCRDFSLTECGRMAHDQFSARIAIREFGPLMVNDIFSSTAAGDRIQVTRSPGDIRRDARDYFMLWLTLEGEVTFAQDGREARMSRDDLVLHDQSQPFTLEFAERARSIMISIPRPLLTTRLVDAPRLTARRISGASKLGALAGSMVRQLAGLDDDITNDAVLRLGSSALDIFATALESELGGEPSLKQSHARLARAKAYIQANLGDPGLDLDAISSGLNVAPRTLNRLFAQEGTTPIRWLWQQRLAASYKALAEGRVEQVTDAALTFGFSDVSHFSRAFKAAFGLSPHSVKGRGALRS